MEGARARRDADASIIVALGGNLAAPDGAVGQRLEQALQALAHHGITVVRASRLWRSKAWPDPNDPPFLNAVAWVDTELGPGATLEALHRVEAQLGRVRGAPNAPRTVDLDLISHGRAVCNSALTLPHPRAAERLFVMGPLCEIAPQWRHPTNGLRACELASHATVGRDARPLSPDAVCKG